MGKTLLLIGAGGFVGGHLRRAAEAMGIEVAAPAREGGCDLLDSASIEACVERVCPDLIVNAAGSASVVASWERPAESFAINATGVLNLLEAVFRRAPEAHLLCLSSAAVYGQQGAGDMPLAELAPVEPVSPYGSAKAAMEMLCATYVRAHGLRVAIVRAFNLVGPGQDSYPVASGFARRIAEAERAGEAEVELAVGNPGAARDHVDVRDGAEALAEISSRELVGTYNLCSGRTLTVSELIDGLAAATPLPVRPRHDPALARPSDPPMVVGDPSLLHEAIGFEPSTTPERSLADLLDWWRAEASAT